MAIPNVTDAFFERLEPGKAGWVVRISVGGDGFVMRASPLVAEVGDVPIEGLIINGGGAIGFLRAIPPAGAPLRIGYLDLGLNDTGITYPAEPNT